MLVSLLTGLILGTMGAGLYFRHYYVVSMFGVWLAVEWGLWRFSHLWRKPAESTATEALPRLSQLLALYGKSDAGSESLLFEKMNEARFQGALTDYERRWLDRLRDLSELRALAFGQPGHGKRALRQAFLPGGLSVSAEALPDDALANLNEQDITESAGVVSELFWKLYHTSLGEFPDLSLLAQKLFKDLFGVPPSAGRDKLERVTDLMQRDYGVPYLMLNLIQGRRASCARRVAQALLTEEVQMDEEIRSALYWMSEVLWFTKDRDEPITDFETTIRYLYHLCFTNPDLAGFLEIDSQFYSEFETVNELAKEGILFKEGLVDKVLGLWGEYPKQFDGVFRNVLEVLSGQRSKIYDNRDAWGKYWERERENSSKDLLAIVEGNLCFASGHYDDALSFYETALEISPHSRAARFNALFCFARRKDEAGFDRHLESILQDPKLLPSALYVIGDAYLMMGRRELSDQYYDELRQWEGWRLRADHYRSTFCFEHRLLEDALAAARLASEVNPEDSSIAYHLSRCYSALGEKEAALKVLTAAPVPEVDWMAYYKFTLERDAGRTEEASRTLLGLSREYFEDPDELEAAVEFARTNQDMRLLRHLKARGE